MSSGKRASPREGVDVRANPKCARIDFRLPADIKDIIEKAAAVQGQSVSAFLLGAAVPRAREVLRDSEFLTLTGSDRELFLGALDDVDAGPNDALRRAAERSKAAIG